MILNNGQKPKGFNDLFGADKRTRFLNGHDMNIHRDNELANRRHKLDAALTVLACGTGMAEAVDSQQDIEEAIKMRQSLIERLGETRIEAGISLTRAHLITDPQSGLVTFLVQRPSINASAGYQIGGNEETLRAHRVNRPETIWGMRWTNIADRPQLTQKVLFVANEFYEVVELMATVTELDTALSPLDPAVSTQSAS